MNPTSPRNIKDDLSVLLGFIECNRIDKRFLNNGGEIIYIVDTDILKLFSDPVGVGVDNKRRRGYSQLFESSDKKIAGHLAITLAQYIFYELNSHHPLMAFNAHLNEMDKIYKAVISDAGKKIQKPRPKNPIVALESIVDLAQKVDISSNGLDVKTSHEELEHKLQTPVSSLLESLTYAKESSRISQLLNIESPRLAGVAFLLENYPEYFSSEYFVDELDIFYSSVIRVDISKQLEIENPAKPESKKAADVEALYNLFVLNKNMIDQGINKRFVLISGDHSVADASIVLDQYIDSWGMDFDEKFIRNKNKSLFSCLFIRHPLSFLNEENFIGRIDYHSYCRELVGKVDSSESRDFNFDEIDQFDDIGSLFEMLDVIHKGNVWHENVEESISNVPSILDDFLKGRFTEYAYRLDGYYNKSVDKLVGKIKSIDSSREAIDELYDEANNYLVKQTNITAFNLKQSASRFPGSEVSQKYCYRVSPFLRFGLLDNAHRYINSWAFDEAGVVDEISPVDILESIGEHDDSGYSVALCNSAVWAYLDRWDFVEDNTGRALRIAFSEEWLSSKLYVGHEAAYLYLVASRHLARYRSKDEVDNYIGNACRLLELTRSLWNRFNNEHHVPGFESAIEEYRFQHEELSLKLMSVWYDLFYFGLPDESDEYEVIEKQLTTIKSTLWKLIFSIEDEIKGECADNQKVDLPGDRVNYLSYTQRHLINNFCLVCIVLNKYMGVDKRLILNDVLQVLSIYESSVNNRTKVKFKSKSYLHAVIMSVSYRLYGEKSTYGVDFSELFSSENIKQFSKKPYEKSRFEFLRDLVI